MDRLHLSGIKDVIVSPPPVVLDFLPKVDKVLSEAKSFEIGTRGLTSVQVRNKKIELREKLTRPLFPRQTPVSGPCIVCEMRNILEAMSAFFTQGSHAGVVQKAPREETKCFEPRSHGFFG